MRLKSIRIRNYKCFQDTGWHDVSPGRTIIVGENSSGKSALLSALSQDFQNQPFRSDALAEGVDVHAASIVDMRFTAQGRELADVILRARSDVFLPKDASTPPATHLDAQTWWHQIQKLDVIEFEVQRRAQGGLEMTRRPSFTLFDTPKGTHMVGHMLRADLTGGLVIPNDAQSTADTDLGITFARTLINEAYVFSAQRVATDEAAVGVQEYLRPDASNLAEVLQVLQASSDLFAEYVALVREVLPNVNKIGIRPIPGNRAQIWVSQFSSARPDLYQPLRECGTGIGQVLALLYVVQNQRRGRSIVIDEPNSFLHPGAMRRLFGVLKRYQKHQFVVATHSPEVIAACEPERILLTRWKSKGSEIVAVDPKQIDEMRLILAEVGARLADVFGADRIIWVEGATEEQCISMLLEHFNLMSPGMVVLGLLNTGDVVGSRRKAVYQRLYAKLSSSSVLIPPAVTFLLDREDLSDQDMRDHIKESGGLVSFHERRTFENYLLFPGAIVRVLNEQNSPAPSITEADVNSWLTKHGTDAAYFKPLPTAALSSPEWVRDVDAPKVLQSLFDLRKIPYSKVAHGVLLTKAVLELSDKLFDPLLNVLRTKIQS